MRLQPVGLLWSGGMNDGPIFATVSMTMARMVALRMPMRMAPLTRRTIRMIVSARAKTKTRIGQPSRRPLTPSPTGTVVPAASGTRRTKPESTSPMRTRNRPIPAAMAVFSPAGTAWNTAVRSPVSTRSVMITPSMTTSPMASAQVIFGAMSYATRALMPRPGRQGEREPGHDPHDDRHNPGHQRGRRGHCRDR